MERRNLLKGIAAAAGAIITGGGASAAKSLATPNTPIGQLTAEPTSPSLDKPSAPLDSKKFEASILDMLKSPYQPYHVHAAECLAELKEYRKQFPREMLPSTQQLALGEMARGTRLRRHGDDPMPELPAFAKLAEMGREDNSGMRQLCVLDRIVKQGWQELTEEQLPTTFIHVPHMVRPTQNLGPERINTAQIRLDVCEMNAWTLADLAGVLLYDPLTYAKTFPVESMRRSCGKADHDVYRVITPLKSHIKREAFMLEAFTYFEVFACFADTDAKVEHMLTSVAPTLKGKPLSELPCVDKHELNRELGIEEEAEADLITYGPGGERGRLASIIAAELACDLPAVRMYKLGELACKDKALYDVVYDTLRQLRDAGLTKT